MSTDHKKNRSPSTHRQEEEEGGSGGQQGQVKFKDFLAPNSSRDDLLSATEIKRLLMMHQDIHEATVKKQKALQEARLQVKEGKVSLQSYRQGQGLSATQSQYLANPVLADKAQFSGVDRQVTALPVENTAETNLAQREELQYRNQLKNRPEKAPRFNPKPHYR